MKVIPEVRRAHYHCVDTTVGGLLVPAGTIRPVVSDLALAWFNRYI
jgi:hypothetical protein